MGNSTSHAPSKKAYYVALLAVHDPEVFNNYLAEFTRVVERYQGKILLTTTDLASKTDSFADHAEGFHRAFVVEFLNVGQARKWYASADYQNIKTTRAKCASGPIIIATGDSPLEVEHKALVVAFAEAPPVPREEEAPLLGPSLKHFHGRLLLNCALKPDHALANQAIEYESMEGEEYDICYLVSFPNMEQAKAWRGSDAYIHLDGPLVALSLA